MKHPFFKLLEHISRKRRLQSLIFIILILICSVAEIMTLGAIVPFLAIITNPEDFLSNYYFTNIFHLLKLNNNDNILLYITITFIALALISGILRLLLLFFQTMLSYGIGYDLSVKVFTTLICQPFSVHVNINTNESISTVSNKTNIIVSSIIMPIFSIISGLILSISIGIILVLIDPVLVISITTVITVIYTFILFVTNSRLKKYSYLISNNLNKTIKIIQESFGSIRDIIIGNSYNSYIDIYKNYDLPLRKAMGNSKLIASSPKFIIESISIAVIAMVAFLLSDKNNIQNIIPILGAIALGAQRVLPLLQGIYSSISSIKSAYIPLEDTLKLLELQYDNDLINRKLKSIKFTKTIALENVSFRYSDKHPYILQNINVTIRKGDKIGFVGETGAGKSTFLDLILGLLNPSSGFLKIDEKLINKKNVKNWQTNIAHVPQSIFLADTTIAENIAFGVSKENINYELIREASKKAGIYKTIIAWENKFDSLVGERGVRISGGQRQRIAIARAFYKNANIIIFDEATSALDNSTEENIINAITARYSAQSNGKLPQS